MAWILLLGGTLGHAQLQTNKFQLTGNQASECLGQTVENEDGETLGRLKDLVVDISTGELKSALISHGGFAGLGAHWKVVRATAISRATAKRRVLSTTLARKEWEKSPSFDSQKLDGTRLSALHGKTVVDNQGQTLGTISDFLITLPPDKPVLAVVTRGGVLNHWESFVTPLAGLALSGRTQATVNWPGHTIEAAAWFDVSAWTERMATNAVFRYAPKPPHQKTKGKKP
ncbi:MAG TPA: PRC-barrel domain-containing protein [Candidatus Dormibacteraeota bacterium]|nr:PRC-barrel domain-containing protein [Candidatus Dormibacteraeota bacterium]